MNNQPAVNWEEDESEFYSSNTSYNPRQYVERSNAPNPGWSGHVQGQQSPDHSGNMFFNAQQSVESLNVAIPGWSGNLQGQESLNPFFNTLQSVEIPNVANSGWLGNLQGQESLNPSGNMFFNTQRSDEILNVANPGWLGNLQGRESLGPSGNMFFNTQRSDEIPNVVNPGWLSNLQGQESLDPSGNQFFNTQQSVEIIPNEANPGWSGNLQGQESLDPSGNQFFNTQQSVEIPNEANPGWSGNLQGQESLNPSGNQFFNTQQSVEIPNEANPGWSGNLQGQESLDPSGNQFFNTQQSVKIPNEANLGWSGNLQGQESLDPSGNQFFNTQQFVEIPNEANPGWSGNLQGQESLDPSGNQFFNTQQSVEIPNEANPGWSGNLQGQESLNPSGQKPRHEIVERVRGNQKVIELALRSLQRQKMPMQQQEQMKQQQMLQMQQNFPLSPPTKIDYKFGMGGERLMQYMNAQRDRPQDNDIEFWRNFVAEFFAPKAKKKWCVSIYGNKNHLTARVPQQNALGWQCEICNRQPGKGIEATAEILPRLFQTKYKSGILEEHLHIQDPQEYITPAGLIIINYAKATQTSVLNQLHIVREGHLRVIFSPELKIGLLNFCVRSHDEFIPRSSLGPKVSQLRDAAEKYQACAQDQNRSSDPELQNLYDGLVASANQLEKSLDSISKWGYPTAYLRILKTADTVNVMKDLIDYSIATGSGAIESLANFPKRERTMVELGQQSQQDQMQQQSAVQNSPSNFSQQSQTRRY